MAAIGAGVAIGLIVVGSGGTALTGLLVALIVTGSISANMGGSVGDVIGDVGVTAGFAGPACTLADNLLPLGGVADPPYYPPNDGFVGKATVETLPVGPQWRYGPKGGRFITPVGTPPEAISLPPNSTGWEDGPTLIRILKPIKGVRSGKAGPWDWPDDGRRVGIGGGHQYKLPKSLKWYIKHKYIADF